MTFNKGIGSPLFRFCSSLGSLKWSEDETMGQSLTCSHVDLAP
jgi:hypothetical protein